MGKEMTKDLKPGLYVPPSGCKRAKRLTDGPVYIDERLSDNDWYVVTGLETEQENDHTRQNAR